MVAPQGRIGADPRPGSLRLTRMNINGDEILILLVLAVVVIGPERLPRYAEQLARLVKTLKNMATGATSALREELGDELADLDFSKFDPRQYDPRRIVRDALLDDVLPTSRPADPEAEKRKAARAAAAQHVAAQEAARASAPAAPSAPLPPAQTAGVATAGAAAAGAAATATAPATVPDLPDAQDVAGTPAIDVPPPPFDTEAT